MVPKTTEVQRKRAPPCDPEVSLSRYETEELIQKAIKSWKQKESPNLLNTAKNHDVAHQYPMPRRRAYGLTESHTSSHKKQRLLTDVQEYVLFQRISSLGVTGDAISKEAIRPLVDDICGRYPSKNWMTHHPDLNVDAFIGTSRIHPTQKGSESEDSNFETCSDSDSDSDTSVTPVDNEPAAAAASANPPFLPSALDASNLQATRSPIVIVFPRTDLSCATQQEHEDEIARLLTRRARRSARTTRGDRMAT